MKTVTIALVLGLLGLSGCDVRLLHLLDRCGAENPDPIHPRDASVPPDTLPADTQIAVDVRQLPDTASVIADTMIASDSVSLPDSQATTDSFVANSDTVIDLIHPMVATIATSGQYINGEQTFYKFSVSAPSSGDIALKRFTVTSMFWEVGSIGNARLFVNGSPTYPVSIGVPGGTWGVDLETGAIKNPAGSLDIVVTADNMIIISAGTTKVFDLRATFSGGHPGSTVTSNIQADPFDSTRGMIDSHPFNYFLWSDCSDLCSLISGDWIGGSSLRYFPTTPATISQ